MKVRVLIAGASSLAALLAAGTASPAAAAAPSTTAASTTAASASAASTTAASASAPSPVLAGLLGPLHLTFGPAGQLYIADTFAGRVLRANVDNGTTHVVADGFSGAPSSVSIARNGSAYVTVTSGGETQTPTSLVRVAPDGTVTTVADLLAYELRNNPDRQPQQTGPNADAVSNPYDVLALPGRILVADAAGNDILTVTPGGKVRTLTVLPVVRTGACANVENNGVPNGGCDPVPTGLAVGPDGFLYVSGLGGLVSGRVYKIDLGTGAVVATIEGFPPLTGIAVGEHGTIYASSLVTNSIFRVGTDGSRRVVTVPGATDVTIGNGAVYAGSLTGTDVPVGKVYRVPFDAFTALP